MVNLFGVQTGVSEETFTFHQNKAESVLCCDQKGVSSADSLTSFFFLIHQVVIAYGFGCIGPKN